MTSSAQVTVIALCYNHAQWVLQCLESIRAQTYQDFQLIVTDDGSTDASSALIAQWLTERRPDALFIRRRTTLGLCRTLNEAISVSRGDFISIIATDDVWEPDKIERQLKCAAGHSDDVAVVYSDATRIDVSGRRVAGDFIETAYPGCSPPSGRIFSMLAERNFIPAMATLIRRRAILEVGGYDERLAFEDYDMWLRVADRWSFIFCPGAVARYRIVPTSLAHSLFGSPSGDRYYSMFLIRGKWLSSRFMTNRQKKVWKDEYCGAADLLYRLSDTRARACLWTAALRTRSGRAFALALACTFGLSRDRLHNVASWCRGRSDLDY